MSIIDAEETVLSETEAGQVDGESDNLKLVPVSESIRYRKRAQIAEKKIEVLSRELMEARSEAERMAGQLNDIHLEQKLTQKLAAAGAIDLETTLLIAKARMEGRDAKDSDGVVEQLKKEKQYLFGGASRMTVTRKTAGARERIHGNGPTLERAAKKAATTGNRTDLQEYLKLRRNFV